MQPSLNDRTDSLSKGVMLKGCWVRGCYRGGVIVATECSTGPWDPLQSPWGCRRQPGWAWVLLEQGHVSPTLSHSLVWGFHLMPVEINARVFTAFRRLWVRHCLKFWDMYLFLWNPSHSQTLHCPSSRGIGCVRDLPLLQVMSQPQLNMACSSLWCWSPIPRGHKRFI